MLRPVRSGIAGLAATAVLTGLIQTVAVADEPEPPPAQQQSQKPATAPPQPTAVPEKQRPRLLGEDWRASADRAWTTSSDAQGFHLLTADKSTGYQWKTAASLSEPGLETDAWIGNACVTASGKHAVAVYAPRTFTNKPELMTRGAFTAVVDLTSGKVTKLAVQSSLAYFSPGCGRGEDAVVSQFADDTAKENATRLVTIDAEAGKAGKPLKLKGQVTSAVPYRDGIAAADGYRVVSIGARGQRTPLATTSGVPFQLRTDRDGGLVFLDRTANDRGTVKRVHAGRTSTLATGRFTDVDLTSSAAGTVFITGKAKTSRTLPGAVKNPGVAKDATASTRGQAVIVSRWQDTKKPPQGADALSVRPVSTSILTLATGHTAKLTASPGDKPVSDARMPQGKNTSPALTAGSGTPKAQRGAAAASPNDPVEDERTCAVPRGSVVKQALQPTPRQIEWAVNQAVIDGLDTWITRPSNWNGTGMSGYSPQVLFPLRALEGDPNGVPDRPDEWHIPSQILLGITAQESNMWQATRTVVPGLTGNPLIGNYYGIKYAADGNQGDPWGINWAKADCGYGITQVTDGMRKADTSLTGAQKEAAALDYTANIAYGADILASKWNQTRKAGMIVNDGKPKYMENWFFALWAYNSGFYPQSEAGNNGGKWGVGWTNNPANPLWKENRTPFLENSTGGDDYSHAAHPQDWPYQEKVIGWAGRPISAMFKPGDMKAGYVGAWWNTNRDRTAAKPPIALFCTEANDCDNDKINEGTSNQTGQGPCTLPGDPNESDPLYLKCWWHDAVKWKDCGSAAQCGYPVHRFNNADYPEQPNENSSYPPRCPSDAPRLPAGTLVVDDIKQGTTPAGQPGHTCGASASAGTFGFTFANSNGTYPAKIDTHQLGAGYGDHFWFTHTRSRADDRLSVTGTWTLNQNIDGWARVMVHMPDHGAHTRQAAYEVKGTNSWSPVRVVPQRTRENRWVSLGAFRFTGTPQVSLSNETSDGTGDEDIAWDAIAFQKLPGKPNHQVVAMGDSYSSGEGASEGNRDYYPETNYRDSTNEKTRNACHRSKEAWSRQAAIPGYSDSIGAMADSFDSRMDYHLVACSAARTYNILEHSQDNANELPQIQQGYLDQNTSLVTLSIGGNDSRFGYIIKKCITTVVGNCQDKDFDNREGNGVDDAKFQGMPVRDAVTGIIGELVYPGVKRTLTEIHRLAPYAKIVLMGYPPLMSSDGQCLNKLGFGIKPAEAAWLNDVAATLAQQMYLAADSVRNDGVDVGFANPQAFFHGKAVCGDPETIHGIVTDKTNSDTEPTSAQSFHPKISGSRLYADTLQEVMKAMGV
ncbi:golvesin C-terminal-like domain-containing protein [Streptomyces phaeochromogenes]|uniref:golvesin C-terminal-like domain-containing protein n=1 Tax=Streptomyces phaeochromogenes TaxID=1923 RepID=UPI0027D7F300|nr:GDSL-type esterase/lipase family protein [Streptomyces phaeochromogenes]